LLEGLETVGGYGRWVTANSQGTFQEPLLLTVLHRCCMESPAIERNLRKSAALRGTALQTRKDAQAAGCGPKPL